MNLLFITRKYPPMVGGMEKVSFALANELSKKTNTTLITWGGSQKLLPLVIPYFFLKALYLIPSKKIDHIHLGDGLLSPLGLTLKKIFNTKTSVTIHGLDITYQNHHYQTIVPRCINKLDKIICISRATMDECLRRGIAKEKCSVIPWGIHPNEFKINATRRDLEKVVGINLKDKKILITVGRLVERKGVYWFIKNVFPRLSKNTIYLVIGTGPEKDKIDTLIDTLNLEDRVLLLGKVSDKVLKTLYNTADIFVMPNIKVKGDIEGFGIVALEASSTGLPVVASNLEGISDAIIHKKNGVLVEANKQSSFVNVITNLNISKRLIANFTRKNYSWEVVGKKYVESFK